MKRFFGGVTALLLLMLGAGLLASPAAHAEGFNIITSPLPIKITTQPGKTVETELRMKNQGNEPEGIKVGLMKFGATGENGEPDLFDLSKQDTYASWVHFSPQQFVAQPNVWNSVKMTINVPKDAGLGYYLAVTFSRAAQPGEAESTNLKGSVATLVLLNVDNGNEKKQLNIDSFSTDHGFYEYLPATFKVRIHNGGNIYVAPTGNVFIQRGSKTISTLDFNTAAGTVLPNSNRVYNVAWKDGFPVYTEELKDGKPIQTKHGPKQDLQWNFTHLNKLRIGRYSAKLLAVYDDGKEDVPLESTLYFWVIPWKIILGILAVVALIGFGIYSLLKPAIGKVTKRVSNVRTKK